MPGKQKKMTFPPPIEALQACPLCETRYSPHAEYVIQAGSGMRFVHMTCSHCRHTMMNMVLYTPGGISAMGIVTDMSADDCMRLCNRGAITIDEIIHVHEALAHNQV